MDSGEEAHDSGHRTGNHMLGPHVVGQRIVVRRLVRGERGPTGGPAFTDLIGTCTAWGDGVCVVAPASGSEVRIALRDIVSGKPVPPRPSVRHRVGAREAEGRARALWPDVERVALGEWELRTAPRTEGEPRHSNNSCLALGDPGMSVDDAAHRVRAFYTDRGREPLVQVDAGSPFAADFAARGWVEVERGVTHFQLGALSRAVRALGSVPAPEGVEVDVDEDGDRLLVRAHLDSAAVAHVRGGISGDWLGVGDLVVEAGWRRRGVAPLLLAELLERGAEQGVRTVWAHVGAEDASALALFDSLGLVTHHTLVCLSGR